MTGDGPAPARRTAHRSPADGLAGLGAMTRFVTRRNRVRLAVWFAVIVGLFAYVGDYYKGLFTTQKALDDFAALSNTPGIKALTGLSAAPATLGGAAGLSAVPGVHDLATSDGHVTFAVDDDELPAVLAAVARLNPRSLVANPPSLEELFLRHYGDELAALNNRGPK